MVIVLFGGNIKNYIRIYIIWIDLRTTIIYISCLYKSHPNKYNKYNFLMSLIDVSKNAIKIGVIQMDLEKTITYIICLYKSK